MTTSLDSSGATEILGKVVAGNFERVVTSEHWKASDWLDDNVDDHDEARGYSVHGWLSGAKDDLKSTFDDWWHD